MGLKITTKDNTKEFERALQNALERGLEAIGMAAETYAKTDGDMPVVTGYARNSITYALAGQEPGTKEYKADKKGQYEKELRTGSYEGTMDGKKGDLFVAIGSNVEYFPSIELGGTNRVAHHVLKRAASEHADRYKQLLEDSLRNA